MIGELEYQRLKALVTPDDDCLRVVGEVVVLLRTEYQRLLMESETARSNNITPKGAGARNFKGLVVLPTGAMPSPSKKANQGLRRRAPIVLDSVPGSPAEGSQPLLQYEDGELLEIDVGTPGVDVSITSGDVSSSGHSPWTGGIDSFSSDDQEGSHRAPSIVLPASAPSLPAHRQQPGTPNSLDEVARTSQQNVRGHVAGTQASGAHIGGQLEALEQSSNPFAAAPGRDVPVALEGPSSKNVGEEHQGSAESMVHAAQVHGQAISRAEFHVHSAAGGDAGVGNSLAKVGRAGQQMQDHHWDSEPTLQTGAHTDSAAMAVKPERLFHPDGILLTVQPQEPSMAEGDVKSQAHEELASKVPASSRLDSAPTPHSEGTNSQVGDTHASEPPSARTESCEGAGADVLLRDTQAPDLDGARAKQSEGADETQASDASTWHYQSTSETGQEGDSHTEQDAEAEDRSAESTGAPQHAAPHQAETFADAGYFGSDQDGSHHADVSAAEETDLSTSHQDELPASEAEEVQKEKRAAKARAKRPFRLEIESLGAHRDDGVLEQKAYSSSSDLLAWGNQGADKCTVKEMSNVAGQAPDQQDGAIGGGPSAVVPGGDPVREFPDSVCVCVCVCVFCMCLCRRKCMAAKIHSSSHTLVCSRRRQRFASSALAGMAWLGKYSGIADSVFIHFAVGQIVIP